MAELREVIFFIAVVILNEKTQTKEGFVKLTKEIAATGSVSAGNA